MDLYSNNLVLNEGYSMSNLLIEKAYGCYLEDINCNKYIDTTLGNGTHILGHSPQVIKESIKNQLNRGILYTTYNQDTYEVAELIKKCVPSVVESVIFCNTGSEATMRAARISRAYTNKNKIAVFSGAWHGGNELFMFDHDYLSDEYTSEHKSAGVPDDFKKNVIVLPYNDAAAFDLIRQNKNELAMVIIEPSQGSNPRDDMFEFLNQLRKVTKENKIILCFDEIITGFKVAIGGCIEYYDIQPDLVTYGKTVGGGLPIGIIAGNARVMGVVQGNKNNLPVFMGGTFSANPLVMSTTKALLKYLIMNKNKIYSDLNSKGNYIKDYINQYCKKNSISMRMIGIGSILRLVFTDYPILSRRDRDLHESDISLQDAFYSHLLVHSSVFVNKNRIIFLSTKHTEEVIDKLLTSIIESITHTFSLD